MRCYANNNFTLKEFSTIQNDTVPVMWANRKSQTTKTRMFIKTKITPDI